MKSIDRITEAYYGSMGESFARKTRERIHWICSKVKGKQVLDAGCSQGITAILLAREGKKVVGIDIEEEAIAYAKEVLNKESEPVRRNVQFHVCNIFDYNAEHPFDTILLTEVLEHFADPASLLETVGKMLADGGTIVVTVPFGINDFVDHKKTYYLVKLLDELEPFFQVKEVHYFGKWIGVVATKQQDKESFFSRELIRDLEHHFYQIERNLLDELSRKDQELKKVHSQLADSMTVQHQLKSKIETTMDKTSQLEARYHQLQQTYEQLMHEYESLNKALKNYKNHEEEYKNRIMELEEVRDHCTYQIKQLEKENENELHKVAKLEEEQQIYIDKIGKLEDEIENYKDKITKLEEELVNKNKEILKLIDDEEEILKKYKSKVLEYNQLEARYAQVSKKYQLLSNAKLGRLTLNYWKFRKRIPKDF